MNIGDKVRLVHGKEQGIVYRFLPNNQVEVEIEDGFRIPVLKSEVVVVSPLEAQRMTKPESKPETGTLSPGRIPKVFAQKGIYMAFVPINDRELTVHLINNSDWKLPFALLEEQEGKLTGLAAGALEPRSTLKVRDLVIQQLESWPTFDFRALYFKEGSIEFLAPFQKRLRCRVQSFYKKKEKAPLLLKEAYLYQLDLEENLNKSSQAPSAEKIREGMLSAQQEKGMVMQKLGSRLDLHIEKLRPDHAGIARSEILGIQLAEYEQYIEKAIANGLDEVTFIHGVGNGILRDELHRRLSKHPNIAYFKDTEKEKFGYGATLVKIK